MHILWLDFGRTRTQQAGWALYKEQGLPGATRAFCICRVYVKTPSSSTSSPFNLEEGVDTLTPVFRFETAGTIGFTLLGKQGELTLGQVTVPEDLVEGSFPISPSLHAAVYIHSKGNRALP